MKENVAVATIQGKAYFLLVSALKDEGISFISLIPGEAIPARVKVVLTTPEEKAKVDYNKILVLECDQEVDSLVVEVKKVLLDKEACERIVVGIDPGQAIGLAVIADGKVIEEATCRSSREVTNTILKVLKTVDFSATNVSVKVGNGVPVYRELTRDLDDAMPPEVYLEVVGEAGTNRPQKVHSRKVRHISSAIRIAGRTGQIVKRRGKNAAESTDEQDYAY